MPPVGTGIGIAEPDELPPMPPPTENDGMLPAPGCGIACWPGIRNAGVLPT